ncbi:MAG: zinc ABC transporter substrate-binding protein [Clostridia bacterium]|nr:zinc ABC transporter substrate-binding protein [Clostridia bacterium]
MKKTIIALIILIVLVLIIVIGFGYTDKYKKKGSSDKIQIVTTVFPLYDFIKNVGGDNVEVSMIIPSGVDVHDYEPTPQDIIKINDADLFLYMGEDIEYWAKTISDGVDNKDKVIDITKRNKFY